MTPLKQTPYWALLADAAAFLSRHLPAQDTDDYLTAICMDANDLAAKWEGRTGMWLMNGILYEMLEELCRAGGLLTSPPAKNRQPSTAPNLPAPKN